MDLSHTVALAAVHSMVVVVVVNSLFIDAPIACGGFEFGPHFVVLYLVSFLVLQSSR